MYISKTLGLLREHKRASSGLSRRQQTGYHPPLQYSVLIIIIVGVFIVLLLVFLFTYFGLRRLRARGKEPTLLPTSFLKRKWKAWTPRSKYAQINQTRSRDLTATSTAYNGSEVEERAASQAAAAGLDRNTSVRSVMTLPAYSMTPHDSEQVIGREGERGGMDTVVEFPETVDDEETRREEQMESLYQIRLARRQELAEREERRRERREARDRGDWARLEELRRASRARATTANSQSTTSLNGGQSVDSATLIAEHQSRGRDRRVSSVAYGSLGEVRHDGTRLRANSNESERGALLDGAAPMGERENRARGNSDATSLYSSLPLPHLRQRSDSSALSISTSISDLEPNVVITTPSTQAEDRPTHSSHSNGTSNSSPTANRFTPDDSTGSDDIGEARNLYSVSAENAPNSNPTRQSRPPEYDHLDWGDAPAYTEAEVQARRASMRASGGVPQHTLTDPLQLTRLDLPSIHVEGATEPNTPVTPHMTVGNVGGSSS